MTAAADHYTAVLTISKTTAPSAPSTSYQDRRHQPDPKPTERAVDEVAKIVVRADTIESLREKLAGHVALVD